jgi:hypothetical protein
VRRRKGRKKKKQKNEVERFGESQTAGACPVTAGFSPSKTQIEKILEKMMWQMN